MLAFGCSVAETAGLSVVVGLTSGVAEVASGVAEVASSTGFADSVVGKTASAV